MGETKKEKKVKGESWRGRDKPRARSRWNYSVQLMRYKGLSAFRKVCQAKTERDAFRLSLLPRSSS